MAGLVLCVQARMESTRFPGKVVQPLLGQPLLLHVLARASAVPLPHTLVVATPQTPANAAIAALCARHGYTCLLAPGDPDDVLARFAFVAAQTSADVIVRLCGDCPLVSPEVITRLVRCREWAKADYASLAPEWGDGFDCGVFTRDALNRAAAEATRRSDREHVEPYLTRAAWGARLAQLPCPFDLSWFRGSVDTADDLRRIERLLVAALDAGLGAQPEVRALATLAERQQRHKLAMLGKPLNQAYHEQVAAEDLAEGLGAPAVGVTGRDIQDMAEQVATELDLPVADLLDEARRHIVRGLGLEG